MTAAAVKFTVAAPSPLDVFTLRAWARATLVCAGEMALLDAVDELQSAADAYGIDADTAQAVMADAFGGIDA